MPCPAGAGGSVMKKFARILGLIASLSPAAAFAGPVAPPIVPEGIKVPAGNIAYMVGHAVGTQGYVCAPKGLAFEWKLFTPPATLLADDGTQLTTHYFSPNHWQHGIVRPTWLHSRDTSAIRALLHRNPSFDPDFVAPGAVPWLLLRSAGGEVGPDGGDRLTNATFILRVNAAGGIAPAELCGAGNVGAMRFEP